MEVEVTREFPAEAQVAWARVGDFARPDRWIAGLEVVEAAAGVGGVRRVRAAGAEFVERLVSQDALAMRLTYVLENSPLPLASYASHLEVMGLAPQEAGRPHAACRVRWQAQFEPLPGADGERLARAIRKMYEAGLEHLAEVLARS
jgi:hypothetical protein